MRAGNGIWCTFSGPLVPKNPHQISIPTRPGPSPGSGPYRRGRGKYTPPPPGGQKPCGNHGTARRLGERSVEEGDGNRKHPRQHSQTVSTSSALLTVAERVSPSVQTKSAGSISGRILNLAASRFATLAPWCDAPRRANSMPRANQKSIRRRRSIETSPGHFVDVCDLKLSVQMGCVRQTIRFRMRCLNVSSVKLGGGTATQRLIFD